MSKLVKRQYMVNENDVQIKSWLYKIRVNKAQLTINELPNLDVHVNQI